MHARATETAASQFVRCVAEAALAAQHVQRQPGRRFVQQADGLFFERMLLHVQSPWFGGLHSNSRAAQRRASLNAPAQLPTAEGSKNLPSLP
jgi:hypothetical protein